MTTYNYIALQNGKNIVQGQIDADSHRHARTLLREKGLIATKIYSAEEKETIVNQKIKTKKLKKLKLKDKIDFSSIFHTLNTSGVAIIETLYFIETDASSKNVRAVAHELRQMIVSGATFADAIGRHSNIFDNVYIGLIKAGEDSGEMDKTLERIIMLLKKQDAIRAKVIGALMYPCFVVILAFIIMIVMLTFVFPEFQKMFESLGKDLPATTQFCINAGLFIRQNWYYLLFGLIGIGVIVKYAINNNAIRTLIDRMTLKMPIIDELIKFANLANFIAVMFVAYEAGIPIVDCLYLSNLTIENIILKEATSETTRSVQKGQNLSSAMRTTNTFPKMLVFMIAAGEQSGRLGEMLEYSSKYIDNELDKVIDTLTKLVEPFMLIVIGGLVLFMALSLYLPLFQSYQM